MAELSEDQIQHELKRVGLPGPLPLAKCYSITMIDGQRTECGIESKDGSAWILPTMLRVKVPVANRWRCMR